MVKVRSVQHSVEVEKGLKQTNQCTKASPKVCHIILWKHFIFYPTALALFNSSLWTHYPRCKYTLDNCSSVLKDHIERLLSRCPRVFRPPPRSCHCLAGPSVTLSIGSVHGVPSEWAGSQYACQCIDNVKFGVTQCTFAVHIAPELVLKYCDTRPKTDILYCWHHCTLVL